MEYARQEVRFASGGWSGGTLVTGIVTASGSREARRLPVRGLSIRATDAAAPVATHTLLGRLKRRDVLPAEAAVVGDAHSPLPDASARLVGGIPVRHGKTRVGKLTAMWCDRATGQVMHLLVRPSSGLFGRQSERLVPSTDIVTWSDTELVLVDTADFSAYPPYLPDTTIEAQSRAALAGALLSPSARRGVKLRVEDGQVFLAGTVETEEQVAAAQRAVERVRGVREVVLDLVAAESIGARVEQALAAALASNDVGNAARADSGSGNGLGGAKVLSEHGIVYLEGTVPTKELSAALERAAKAVPGVRVVINSLELEADVRVPPSPSQSPSFPGNESTSSPSSALVRAGSSSVRLPTPR